MPYYDYTRRSSLGNLIPLGDTSLTTALVADLVTELQKANPAALVIVDVSGSINQIKHGQIQSTKVSYVRVPRSYYNATSPKMPIRDLRADDGIPQTVFTWVNNKYIAQAGTLARVLAKQLPAPSDSQPQSPVAVQPTIQPTTVTALQPAQPGPAPAQSATSAFTSPRVLLLGGLGAVVLAAILLRKKSGSPTT